MARVHATTGLVFNIYGFVLPDNQRGINFPRAYVDVCELSLWDKGLLMRRMVRIIADAWRAATASSFVAPSSIIDPLSY